MFIILYFQEIYIFYLNIYYSRCLKLLISYYIYDVFFSWWAHSVTYGGPKFSLTKTQTLASNTPDSRWTAPSLRNPYILKENGRLLIISHKKLSNHSLVLEPTS